MPEERWLITISPFVRDNLPAPPARVVEIGCGPFGGFVPRMRTGGYRAVGIDPEAPEEHDYRRVEFERRDDPEPADAVVACTSLHHVVEATARWCLDRLAPAGDEPGWLHECQAEWRTSGEPWDACGRNWAHQERLHAGQDIVRALDARFDRRRLDFGPYFFPHLDDVSHEDEAAAIHAGLLQATCIQYVGRPRQETDAPDVGSVQS